MYSHWLCYVCHCNLAVIVTVNAVYKTFNDTEEYSLRSIAILGCNIYSQIAVAHVTLPKAVLSTVEIFAVYTATLFLSKSIQLEYTNAYAQNGTFAILSSSIHYKYFDCT